ncbi:MAG: recombination protein RecR [Victivallales bacterium]|nr:recombination protein RecR [Victivallales bacterium]
MPDASLSSKYPEALDAAIGFFAHLPGIGKRTAERLGLALMSWKPDDVAAFAETLAELRQKVVSCPVCGNFAPAGQPCSICSSPARRHDIICVVEHVTQILTIEKSASFDGLYHVLGGKLSPLNGIGPEDLNIAKLEQRLQEHSVSELVIATTPDVEGEATAHYLAGLFQPRGILVSRIAAGVPVGADLSYADAATLASAISHRRKM